MRTGRIKSHYHIHIYDGAEVNVQILFFSSVKLFFCYYLCLTSLMRCFERLRQETVGEPKIVSWQFSYSTALRD